MIYDEISKYIPDGWSSLVVYLEYGDESYSFSFYVRIGNRYIKCYELPNVSDEDLELTFEKIDNFVAKARDNERDPWSNMTIVVDNSGNMKTYFDYTDLSNGNYQYKKTWKQQYLK